MENQMKRGLLDVCVLAAIKCEDSYGYQIVKDLSPYVEISESTLYPILRRLENSLMLTVSSRLPEVYQIHRLLLSKNNPCIEQGILRE